MSFSAKLCLLVIALVSVAGAQQQATDVTLEANETLFSTLAALNACGYDDEIAQSHPLRAVIREEVARRATATPEALAAHKEICTFFREHSEGSADLVSPYISLSLLLGTPPDFPLVIEEADLPPDATYVLGFTPVLRKFYRQAQLHQVWLKHQEQYEKLVRSHREPIANMLRATYTYLRMPHEPSSRRTVSIFLDPLIAPGEANARNYGDDYFLVSSPGGQGLNIDQVRHLYLHYLLDPFAQRRKQAMKRLEPLLLSVTKAPLEEQYRGDIALLVTESLIRALEVRMDEKGEEGKSEARVQQAMESGFIVTRYFYEALGEFQKGQQSLNAAFPELLFNLKVSAEQRRAEGIKFADRAAPEVLAASKKEPDLLQQAESRLKAGDAAGAQALAQQALDRGADRGEAWFIAARAAAMQSDAAGAQSNFEKALEVSKDARVLSWSHVYLGRMFDLREEREKATEHYSAALKIEGAPAEARAAAERGMQQPHGSKSQPKE